MQSLTAPPPMASPYTPAGGSNTPSNMPQPPKLGAPIPGTTGGLPAKPGLSVFDNPLDTSLQSQPNAPQNPQAQNAAQHAQSYGRGDDTVLVHMTPDEVNSLQGLAMASGGSLTINPHTGLPEAGWLGKLLPMIAGLGLNFLLPGVGSAIGSALGGIGGAAGTGLLVGAGTAAITGDLKEGLMAGLGAYGGASLAGGLKTLGTTAVKSATPAVTGSAATGAPVNLLEQLPNGIGGGISKELVTTLTPNGGISSVVGGVGSQVAKTGLPGVLQGFGQAARGSMTGIAGKLAPSLATMGVINSVSGAMTPSGVKDQQTGVVDNSFQGPYYQQPRNVIASPTTDQLKTQSGERRWFDTSVPEVYNVSGQMVQPGSNTAPGAQIWQPVLNAKAKKGENMYTFQPTTYRANEMQNPQQTLLAQMYPNLYGNLGYAHGGEVAMDEGSFVMPARETAEFGKGSTDAGQRALAGLGGIPIKGPGDGTSDSIPARIGGTQEARVADGEVYFPAEAVKRIGGGSAKKGTQKLYAMMQKAEQSRKSAARGGDGANLMRGLA